MVTPGQFSRVFSAFPACVGAIVFAFSLLAHAAPQNQPKSITVTLDDNYPPYSFRNQDGQLQGIRKDIWDLWSKKTGIAVRLIATDWGKTLPILLANHADVIDTIYNTEERAKKLDFSAPYAKLDTAIFFHKTISGIRDVGDLRGFTIGAKEGGTTTAWLASKGISELRKYPSYEAIIHAAENDEIRVFIMETAPAMHLLFKHQMEKEFRFSEPQYTGHFHWATKKGNEELHKIVAQGFAQISEDEQTKIEKRWIGNTLQNIKEERYVRYTIIVLVAGGLLSGALLLLSWMLRRKIAHRTAELSSTMEALRASEREGRMLFEAST
ncbi:MAG: putative diguanylate phosphodiesterase with sensor(S), partial [Burkholderiaceae bacterium]|nr:putative diguanylate phosphodiesterase with sensor(S) [Burkholderiaceae bacterium]